MIAPLTDDERERMIIDKNWQPKRFKFRRNPYLSRLALADISDDMTRLAYEQELLAVDNDE